jgi:hypothetical protein
MFNCYFINKMKHLKRAILMIILIIYVISDSFYHFKLTNDKVLNIIGHPKLPIFSITNSGNEAWYYIKRGTPHFLVAYERNVLTKENHLYISTIPKAIPPNCLDITYSSDTPVGKAIEGIIHLAQIEETNETVNIVIESANPVTTVTARPFTADNIAQFFNDKTLQNNYAEYILKFNPEEKIELGEVLHVELLKRRLTKLK